MGLAIVRDLDFSVAFGGNDGTYIAPFGDDSAKRLTIQQARRSGNIIGLNAGQNEAQQPTLRIIKEISNADTSHQVELL